MRRTRGILGRVLGFRPVAAHPVCGWGWLGAQVRPLELCMIRGWEAAPAGLWEVLQAGLALQRRLRAGGWQSSPLLCEARSGVMLGPV